MNSLFKSTKLPVHQDGLAAKLQAPLSQGGPRLLRVEKIQATVIEVIEGNGSQDDVLRTVVYLFDSDGGVLARLDPTEP